MEVEELDKLGSKPIILIVDYVWLLVHLVLESCDLCGKLLVKLCLII